MATVERTPRQQSFKQTAKDFAVWRSKNPDADLKRQVEAFNSIADQNFINRKPRPKKAVPKKEPKRESKRI